MLVSIEPPFCVRHHTPNDTHRIHGTLEQEGKAGPRSEPQRACARSPHPTMCGRARSTRSPHAVAQAFGVLPSRVYGAAAYQPRSNFHPGQAGPVLVREDGRAHTYHQRTQPASPATAAAAAAARPAFPPSGAAKAKAQAEKGERARDAKEHAKGNGDVAPPKPGETSVVLMYWGLVPSWWKESKPDWFKAFNARSETVSSKPFFKRLVNSRRCVVVLDGFYEWVVDGKGQKQPYYVHYEDGRPMTFAGLYDCWETPEGELLYTYTILTRDPSPAWAWLHNRFPLVLATKEAEAQWLDTAKFKADDILKGLREAKDIPGMVCHPCSKKMNNMQYEGADAADPITLEAPGKAAAAAAGMPTLHRFFSPSASSSSPSPSGKGQKKPMPASAASAPSPPYHSPPHRKEQGVKKEEEESDDDEVVVLTPSAEETAGGGDARKHAAAMPAAATAGSGSGGKKRGAGGGGGCAEGWPGGKRQKHKVEAGFPKSK